MMSERHFTRYTRALASICGLALVAAGCKATLPGRGMGDEVHPSQDVVVNSEQARVRVRAVVQPYCGAIVASADRISTGTPSRAIRRQALLWKIEAVPALRETLFRPNPFNAVADTWALLWQMTDYFETGPGRQALGDAAPVAAATCRHLEQEFRGIAVSLTRSGDITNASDFVRQWAADHPIHYSIAGRESMLSYFSEQELQEKFSVQEVAGSLAVTVDDLSRRMDIYSAQLFEQARWQAELFAMDVSEDYRLDQAMPLARNAVRSTEDIAQTIDRMVDPFGKTLAVLEATPETIEKERVAAIEALHEEISRSIEVVEQLRVVVFDELTKQREAALTELHGTVTEEREALTRDMEEISLKAVDHAFRRMTQLVAVISSAFFVWSILFLFLARWLFSGKKMKG